MSKNFDVREGAGFIVVIRHFQIGSGGESHMFGVLTYDAYHLALYLLTALAWGALGFGYLLRSTDAQALCKCCAMFGLALAINAVVLVLDIFRVIAHHEVELILLIVGMLLPAIMFLTLKAALFASKLNLKKL